MERTRRGSGGLVVKPTRAAAHVGVFRANVSIVDSQVESQPVELSRSESAHGARVCIRIQLLSSYHILRARARARAGRAAAKVRLVPSSLSNRLQ